MTKWKSAFVVANTIIIYLVAAIGIFAAIEFIAKSPIWSDKGATWIQAIGSILAIASAVFIMKRQSEHAAKLAVDMDVRAMARRLAALEALVERGYQMSITVGIHTKPIASYWHYFFSTVKPDHLQAITHALKSVPLYTLESYNLVIGVHDMIIGLENLEPFVVIHQAAGDVHYTFEGNDASQVNYICKKIQEARDMVRMAIIDLGHTPISPAEAPE